MITFCQIIFLDLSRLFSILDPRLGWKCVENDIFEYFSYGLDTILG